jgi:hypothetical protein
MTDIPIIDDRRTNELLRALGEQLAAREAHYTLVVVGGSALLALALVTRTTRDVDVVALEQDGRLVSAEPLPRPLVEAAHTIARDFGLPEDWLNTGPASLLDFGLPGGFHERTVPHRYGPGLDVLFASRLDQVHLKLYAAADQGAGRHLSDLRALNPTREELIAAAIWSRSHDPSEAHLGILEQLLDHLGVKDHGFLGA